MNKKLKVVAHIHRKKRKITKQRIKEVKLKVLKDKEQKAKELKAKAQKAEELKNKDRKPEIVSEVIPDVVVNENKEQEQIIEEPKPGELKPEDNKESTPLT